MSLSAHYRDTDQLRRLHQHKSAVPVAGTALGQDLVKFFKLSVQRRQTRLSTIAECWGALVPVLLQEHCALESFNRGALVVLVDSPSHLYELRQLLLAGLQQQVLLACQKTGLRKISLRYGRWYAADNRVNFEN